MEYTKLGRTGLDVSRICLGCMSYGGGNRGNHAWSLDEEESRPFIKKALEAGINFFDTANRYSLGNSEEILGRAIGDFARRDEVVIATKVYGRMRPGPNGAGLSRKAIFVEIDASLTRLGMDYIDLYQIHRFDPLTAMEDTVRALDDLVRSGKVRYIGCSNLLAWQLMKALSISRAERLEHFRCTQSYYSLVGRELERETLPLLADQKLGLLVWSPLAGGFLTGKFTRDGKDASARRASFNFPPIDLEKGFAILDAARTVGANHGASIAQVAIAWLLAREAVTSVIIGARTPAQLDDNLKSVDVRLSPEEIRLLDEVSSLEPEYPAWMDRMPSDRLPGEERRFDTVKA